MDAKKYNNTKLIWGLFESFITLALLAFFIFLGINKTLEHIVLSYIKNEYLGFLAYFAIIGLFSSLLFSPLSYYLEFYLEHKYSLSNQTVSTWLKEKVKELFVGVAIGIPVLLAFFYCLRNFHDNWWLIFATIMFLLSVVLSQIFPIVIFPIFYKSEELENGDLKNIVSDLCNKNGITVSNVFKFDMSKNTKKANAMFTGLGKTKRIYLADNLTDKFTLEEIETVFAHEIGHFKRKHIVYNIVVGTISSYLTLFLINYFYSNSLAALSLNNVAQIAAIPLFFFYMSLLSIITSPFSSWLSRTFEYQADEYAVLITNKYDSFVSALNKLAEQNLADMEPHWFVEWYFYSHPSIKNRIRYIEKLKMENIK